MLKWIEERRYPWYLYPPNTFTLNYIVVCKIFIFYFIYLNIYKLMPIYYNQLNIITTVRIIVEKRGPLGPTIERGKVRGGEGISF